MASQDRLAHHLAAGFLEKASLYAAKYGQENLHVVMEKALSSLTEEFRSNDGADAAAGPESEAVVLACQIARMTLAADRKRVN
jgi:hypothetical protein